MVGLKFDRMPRLEEFSVGSHPLRLWSRLGTVGPRGDGLALGGTE